MNAKMENSGRLEAVIMKQIRDSLAIKFIAFYPNATIDQAHLTYELDYMGPDFNSNIKLSDYFQSINMVQKIGNSLSLGFELVNVPQRKLNVFNYALKYATQQNVFYAQYHAT